jgi:hypothetical protein
MSFSLELFQTAVFLDSFGAADGSPRINHSIKLSTAFLRFPSNLSFVLPGGITIEWIRAPLTQQHQFRYTQAAQETHVLSRQDHPCPRSFAKRNKRC